MKTYKRLWQPFISKDNWELAYKNSIKKKAQQRQIMEFDKDKENNIERIRQAVISGEFKTSMYYQKKIYEPKSRDIFVLPYDPDRLVQHAVMNILKPYFINMFIENSFACVEGRGQIKASQKCQEYTRKYDWCLQCDIHKFFPSIVQNKLSNMLHERFHDRKFMSVIDNIVYSFDPNNVINYSTELYDYEDGCNEPIGNYCSIWFGNFYLTPLDNLILHSIKPEGYLRYCDDFHLYSNTKYKLLYAKRIIEEFIYDYLRLRFSKANILRTIHGIDFCGYRHYKDYILVRKSTEKRLIKNMRDIENDLKTHTDQLDIEYVFGYLAAINGILKHAKTNNLREAIHYDRVLEEVKRIA